MKKLNELIASDEIVILDGAWGTELNLLGLISGTCPELWNIEKPELVEKIAKSYVDAGAKIILTNTFGGTSIKLKKFGLENKVRELNKAGVQISKRAVGINAFVFASVGPTGEFLEPIGDFSVSKMTEIFAEQIEAMIEGGADAILIETMSDLEEVKCAISATKSIDKNIPIAVSFTFEKGLNGFATMMGVTPRIACEQLNDLVNIIGANCGNGPDSMIELVREISVYTKLPIWSRANAGLPILVDGKTVFPASAAEMKTAVPKLIAAGARFIGGCCGTTPEHIQAMSRCNFE